MASEDALFFQTDIEKKFCDEIKAVVTKFRHDDSFDGITVANLLVHTCLPRGRRTKIQKGLKKLNSSPRKESPSSAPPLLVAMETDSSSSSSGGSTGDVHVAPDQRPSPPTSCVAVADDSSSPRGKSSLVPREVVVNSQEKVADARGGPLLVVNNTAKHPGVLPWKGVVGKHLGILLCFLEQNKGDRATAVQTLTSLLSQKGFACVTALYLSYGSLAPGDLLFLMDGGRNERVAPLVIVARLEACLRFHSLHGEISEPPVPFSPEVHLICDFLSSLDEEVFLDVCSSGTDVRDEEGKRARHEERWTSFVAGLPPAALCYKVPAEWDVLHTNFRWAAYAMDQESWVLYESERLLPLSGGESPVQRAPVCWSPPNRVPYLQICAKKFKSREGVVEETVLPANSLVQCAACARKSLVSLLPEVFTRFPELSMARTVSSSSPLKGAKQRPVASGSVLWDLDSSIAGWCALCYGLSGAINPFPPCPAERTVFQKMLTHVFPVLLLSQSFSVFRLIAFIYLVDSVAVAATAGLAETGPDEQERLAKRWAGVTSRNLFFDVPPVVVPSSLSATMPFLSPLGASVRVEQVAGRPTAWNLLVRLSGEGGVLGPGRSADERVLYKEVRVVADSERGRRRGAPQRWYVVFSDADRKAGFAKMMPWCPGENLLALSDVASPLFTTMHKKQAGQVDVRELCDSFLIVYGVKTSYALLRLGLVPRYMRIVYTESNLNTLARNPLQKEAYHQFIEPTNYLHLLGTISYQALPLYTTRTSLQLKLWTRKLAQPGWSEVVAKAAGLIQSLNKARQANIERFLHFLTGSSGKQVEEMHGGFLDEVNHPVVCLKYEGVSRALRGFCDYARAALAMEGLGEESPQAEGRRQLDSINKHFFAALAENPLLLLEHKLREPREGTAQTLFSKFVATVNTTLTRSLQRQDGGGHGVEEAAEEALPPFYSLLEERAPDDYQEKGPAHEPKPVSASHRRKPAPPEDASVKKELPVHFMIENNPDYIPIVYEMLFRVLLEVLGSVGSFMLVCQNSSWAEFARIYIKRCFGVLMAQHRARPIFSMFSLLARRRQDPCITLLGSEEKDGAAPGRAHTAPSGGGGSSKPTTRPSKKRKIESSSRKAAARKEPALFFITEGPGAKMSETPPNTLESFVAALENPPAHPPPALIPATDQGSNLMCTSLPVACPRNDEEKTARLEWGWSSPQDYGAEPTRPVFQATPRHAAWVQALENHVGGKCTDKTLLPAIAADFRLVSGRRLEITEPFSLLVLLKYLSTFGGQAVASPAEMITRTEGEQNGHEEEDIAKLPTPAATQPVHSGDPFELFDAWGDSKAAVHEDSKERRLDEPSATDRASSARLAHGQPPALTALYPPSRASGDGPVLFAKKDDEEYGGASLSTASDQGWRLLGFDPRPNKDQEVFVGWLRGLSRGTSYSAWCEAVNLCYLLSFRDAVIMLTRAFSNQVADAVKTFGHGSSDFHLESLLVRQSRAFGEGFVAAESLQFYKQSRDMDKTPWTRKKGRPPNTDPSRQPVVYSHVRFGLNHAKDPAEPPPVAPAVDLSQELASALRAASSAAEGRQPTQQAKGSSKKRSFAQATSDLAVQQLAHGDAVARLLATPGRVFSRTNPDFLENLSAAAVQRRCVEDELRVAACLLTRADYDAAAAGQELWQNPACTTIDLSNTRTSFQLRELARDEENKSEQPPPDPSCQYFSFRHLVPTPPLIDLVTYSCSQGLDYICEKQSAAVLRVKNTEVSQARGAICTTKEIYREGQALHLTPVVFPTPLTDPELLKDTLTNPFLRQNPIVLLSPAWPDGMYPPGLVPPGKVLAEIGAAAQNTTMIRPSPLDTQFARACKSSWLFLSSESLNAMCGRFEHIQSRLESRKNHHLSKETSFQLPIDHNIFQQSTTIPLPMAEERAPREQSVAEHSDNNPAPNAPAAEEPRFTPHDPSAPPSLNNDADPDGHGLPSDSINDFFDNLLGV